MRTAASMVVVTLLLVFGSSAAAQSPDAEQAVSDVCLTVRAPSDVDLTDPVMVQIAIATGNAAVLEVVACDPEADSPPSATSPVSTQGAWILTEDKDPMTDEAYAFAVLEEDGGAAFGGKVTLAMACNVSKETLMIIDWGDYLGSDPFVDVETRLGDGASSKSRWFKPDSGNSTILIDDEAKELFNKMLTETTLVVRTTPYNDTPTTGTFTLTGIEDAAQRVRELCGW